MKPAVVTALLLSVIATDASAQTAEEAVAMMMFGSTKATGFTIHNDIRALDRKGVSIGYYKRTTSNVSIRQIDGCRYEIVKDMSVTENQTIRAAGSKPDQYTQHMRTIFDFSKISTYKVEAMQSPAEAVANFDNNLPRGQIQTVLLVSMEGSKFLQLIRPDVSPTWDRWMNEVQWPYVDISRLQKAHEFFRASFCAARPF
ncbi:MAG: hypothetical protein AAB403_07270 [Planctomycetota bacterium]